MKRLIEQLRDRNRQQRADRVQLAPLVRAVIASCSDRRPRPGLAPVVDEHFRVLADYDHLAAALEHVIRNAQDATAPDGTIAVRIGWSNGAGRVEIEDDGAGMTPEFVRDRLFRPFDSTKGARGMGIGAHQVREYVRGIGGDVLVQSSPGSGTRFVITLPLCPAQGAGDD
jgi:signal transduction histidine kinase